MARMARRRKPKRKRTPRTRRQRGSRYSSGELLLAGLGAILLIFFAVLAINAIFGGD